MESHIRNFVIIAHIDHGKSTLADRFLEVTGTVSARDMKEQYLDSMELERERGITIKMAPVRMQWKGVELNLIDTPGHSDFSYEVSRALKAVEGAILLLDATQGIQAQTLANLEMARQSGLKVIGALNKVDMNPVGVDELADELAILLGIPLEKIHRISAKTGLGVEDLLDSVVTDVPAPKISKEASALIFSSLYDEHKGIIAFVRVFGGEFKRDDRTKLHAVGEHFKVKEVGYFAPQLEVLGSLKMGEIGYIATGVKNPDRILIGDTIGEKELPGFKCGFLGRLHFEITMQRLEIEFGLATINSFPSVAYRVVKRGGKEQIIENARDFPDDPEKSLEPIVKLNILTPSEYLGSVLGLNKFYRMRDVQTDNAGRNIRVEAKLPLAELIMDFDDKLKSVSQGFASFSYEPFGYEQAELQRLDIYIAGELVHGLSRVVYKADTESEGRRMEEK